MLRITKKSGVYTRKDFSHQRGQARLPKLASTSLANSLGVFGNSGQALLIVVLVMVVALTVGLSVASRSIVTVQTTNEEENSKRAFSAAEAGIERVLKTGTPITSGPATSVKLGNNSQIDSVRVTAIAGNILSLAGGNLISRDEGIDVWLVPHKPDGTPDFNAPAQPPNLLVYWGSSSEVCSPTPNAAALELIVIFGPAASPTIKRQVFDPCRTTTRSANNFTAADIAPPGIPYKLTPDTASVISKPYYFRTPSAAQLNFTGALLMRIAPLYSSTPIAVHACNAAGAGCTSLPGQGNRLDSVGISGNTMRQVSFFQGYPQIPPEFFQYAIFCTSGNVCK